MLWKSSSGATQAVVLDISKAFDGVWYAGLLHKLKPYGISGQVFGLIFFPISVIDNNNTGAIDMKMDGSVLE